jgi:hypothetical protein
MTPLTEIPINSLAWMFGTAACLALGIRSLIIYRRSNSQLTKYLCWFFLLISISLVFFGFPALFTLDEGILHLSYVIGEFFMYIGFIAQAAVLWSLLLRQYFSVYTLTIPVGIIGLATWLYATPNSAIYLKDNFIDYSEPGICSFSMGILFIGLFMPVGLHFLRATMRQDGFKDRLVTFVLGMVYAGIGISTGVHLFTVGHATSPAASVGNLVFFIALIASIALPRREPAQTMLPEVRQTAPNSSVS